MKNKSVHSCRFVHQATFHCIMTTLNKLFKFEFERVGGTGKELQGLSKNKAVINKHLKFKKRAFQICLFDINMFKIMPQNFKQRKTSSHTILHCKKS